jgi:tetratricopeptide (TPR) repeat protein
MSPEQAQGVEVDQRTDLWSLGVMAYEMLGGVHPFQAASHAATLGRILVAEPQPLGELRPDVPEPLQRLVGLLLRKDPAQRPQSAAEVLQGLARLQRDGARSAVDAAAEATTLRPASPARGRPRLRRAAVAAGAVVLGAGALWLLAAGRPDKARPLSKFEELCLKNQAIYDEARQLYDEQRFEAALELAEQLRPGPDCVMPVLKLKGLISRIYVFELHDYEKGIAAAAEGIELDSRQSTLWFTQGYAQYQLDRYPQALDSFRQVLKPSAVPVPDDVLIQTLFLLADTADRLALVEREKGNAAGHEELLRDALGAWKRFVSLCNELRCAEPEKLERAEQQVRQLESLSPEPAKPAR